MAGWISTCVFTFLLTFQGTVGNEAAEPKCQSIIVEYGPQCEPFDNCTGLQCEVDYPAVNASIVVHNCEDPVKVDLTITDNDENFDFYQQFTLGNTSCGDVWVTMSRNATYLDFSASMIFEGDTAVLIPPVSVFLNSSDCMCKSIQDLASLTHTDVEHNCSANSDCDGETCELDWFGSIIFLTTIFLPCTDPPSMDVLVTDADMQVLMDRAFNESINTVLQVGSVQLPAEITIIHYNYSMEVEADLVNVSMWNIDRIGAIPHHTISLDYSDCPEMAPPSPTQSDCTVGNEAAEPKCQSIILEYGPQCEPFDNCTGLQCEVDYPAVNASIVVHNCEDPVKVDLTITDNDGNFDFYQQFTLGNTSCGDVWVAMSRNATYLDFSASMIFGGDIAVVLIPPVSVFLNSSDCMCKSIQDLASTTHSQVEHDCNANSECDGETCELDLFGNVFYIITTFFPCTDPPSMGIMVNDSDMQVLMDRVFNKSINTVLQVGDVALPAEITIIHHNYSMEVEVDLVNVPVLNIDRIDVTPRHTILLDYSDCPEMAPPTSPFQSGPVPCPSGTPPTTALPTTTPPTTAPPTTAPPTPTPPTTAPPTTAPPTTAPPTPTQPTTALPTTTPPTTAPPTTAPPTTAPPTPTPPTTTPPTTALPTPTPPTTTPPTTTLPTTAPPTPTPPTTAPPTTAPPTPTPPTTTPPTTAPPTPTPPTTTPPTTTLPTPTPPTTTPPTTTPPTTAPPTTAAEPKCQSIIVEYGPQCEPFDNCTGLQCEVDYPAVNPSFVVHNCEDPVKVDLTITDNDGNFDFYQQFTLGETSCGDVWVAMSRNATYLDFSASMIFGGDIAVVLIPPVSVFLNSSDCMCKSIQDLASTTHSQVEHDCNANSEFECDGETCELDLFGNVFYIITTFFPCTDPPSMGIMVTDSDMQVLMDRVFNKSVNTVLQVGDVALPAEITIIHHNYSMEVEVDLVNVPVLNIDRIDLTPRHTILLDYSDCPEMAPPSPTQSGPVPCPSGTPPTTAPPIVTQSSDKEKKVIAAVVPIGTILIVAAVALVAIGAYVLHAKRKRKTFTFKHMQEPEKIDMDSYPAVNFEEKEKTSISEVGEEPK